MITYVFGKTGSGKSYKAVTLILKELEARPVFSNIKLTKFLAGYTYLDQDKMKDWLSFIEDIFISSQENLTGEEEIYSALREKGISDCAIFIDEAHIYGFNNTKKKDFLMFFLALQRHVNLNIFLITQTRKQLNTLFHDLGDVVITAMSPTERLSSKVLEYKYFSHVDDVKKPKSAFKSEKVLPKKEIFALYTSGESNLGDDGFRKKLKYLIVGIVIVALFVINQFSGLLSNKNKNENNKNIETSSALNTVASIVPTFSYSKYITLNCNSLDCTNSKYEVFIFVDDLNYTIVSTNSKVLSHKDYSSNYSVITLLVTDTFLNLFKRIKYGKKNNITNNNFIKQ